MIGLFAVSQNATTNTLIQIVVPDRLRGRVMSAYMMIFQGIMPFGNLQAGFAAEHWGSPLAVRVGGGIALVYAVFVALRMRTLADTGIISGDEDLESVPTPPVEARKSVS